MEIQSKRNYLKLTKRNIQQNVLKRLFIWKKINPSKHPVRYIALGLHCIEHFPCSESFGNLFYLSSKTRSDIVHSINVCIR